MLGRQGEWVPEELPGSRPCFHSRFGLARHRTDGGGERAGSGAGAEDGGEALIGSAWRRTSHEEGLRASARRVRLARGDPGPPATAGSDREGRPGRQGSAKAEASKTPLPHRPERTVTPPTLTSAELDRLVEQYLAKTDPKVEPAPLTSDVEFVRRIYFDLAGTPPTPAAGCLASSASKAKDKRARLIERLLKSPEFARNWARYWRDVIRFHATNQNPGQVRYDRLEDWLAEQFQKNRPWDEIATELITATGRVDENGAVSFPLAHEAKPVELAGEVSRIFLGVQIQCAQCHDHKTDSWKQSSSTSSPRSSRATRARVGHPGHARAVAGLRGPAQGPAAVHDARQGRPQEADSRRPPVLPGVVQEPSPAAPEPGDDQRAARWPPRTSPGRTTPGSPGRSSTGSGTS